MFTSAPHLPLAFHPPPPPPPPPPHPVLPPLLQSLLSAPASGTSSLWESDNLRNHITSTRGTLDLLKALKKELEAILALKRSGGSVTDDGVLLRFFDEIKRKGLSLDAQEAISLGAAKSLYSTLKDQITPFYAVTDDSCPWQTRSEAVQLAQKLRKHQKNKKWRKKKRRQVAESIQKEQEMHEKADREADEWRTREIAKDIAKRKMEKMKEIAKIKANEEKKRIESEFELVLVVEKLQELRAIRIQKLKKQGHFIPEEDNEFLDRVRAAFEEEERQAAAAADTDAAKDAIASAEESRKTKQTLSNKTADVRLVNKVDDADIDLSGVQNEKGSHLTTRPKYDQLDVEGQSDLGGNNSLPNLPLEFYHYYHGSNYDMGTLIEVRRTWDAYIRRGGSRIPGHWVQPPPPANEIWASYLVSNKHTRL